MIKKYDRIIFIGDSLTRQIFTSFVLQIIHQLNVGEYGLSWSAVADTIQVRRNSQGKAIRLIKGCISVMEESMKDDIGGTLICYSDYVSPRPGKGDLQSTRLIQYVDKNSNTKNGKNIYLKDLTEKDIMLVGWGTWGLGMHRPTNDHMELKSFLKQSYENLFSGQAMEETRIIAIDYLAQHFNKSFGFFPREEDDDQLKQRNICVNRISPNPPYFIANELKKMEKKKMNIIHFPIFNLSVDAVEMHTNEDCTHYCINGELMRIIGRLVISVII